VKRYLNEDRNCDGGMGSECSLENPCDPCERDQLSVSYFAFGDMYVLVAGSEATFCLMPYVTRHILLFGVDMEFGKMSHVLHRFQSKSKSRYNETSIYYNALLLCMHVR
jgi:hypothetical protein